MLAIAIPSWIYFRYRLLSFRRFWPVAFDVLVKFINLPLSVADLLTFVKNSKLSVCHLVTWWLEVCVPISFQSSEYCQKYCHLEILQIRVNAYSHPTPKIYVLFGGFDGVNQDCVLAPCSLLHCNRLDHVKMCGDHETAVGNTIMSLMGLCCSLMTWAAWMQILTQFESLRCRCSDDGSA